MSLVKDLFSPIEIGSLIPFFRMVRESKMLSEFMAVVGNVLYLSKSHNTLNTILGTLAP